MKFYIIGIIIFILIFVLRGIILVYRWECYYFVWLEMDLDFFIFFVMDVWKFDMYIVE